MIKAIVLVARRILHRIRRHLLLCGWLRAFSVFVCHEKEDYLFDNETETICSVSGIQLEITMQNMVQEVVTTDHTEEQFIRMDETSCAMTN